MTYPLPTLAPTIDSFGISIPTYFDVFSSLQESFKQIYGSDIYIEPDSQDGQWIGIMAKAIHDSNQVAQYLFQSFSPTFSQGAELSSLVKINGISRANSGYSEAIGDIIGVAGTIIHEGVVQDQDGNYWNLPLATTIPIGGLITVRVNAQKPGAISAPIGTINKIANPQLGWQSFSNTSAATVGAAVESDQQLKARQKISVSLPSQSTLTGILSAVGNVPGVIRFSAVENDTNSTDSNGLPPHSFAVIAEGGTVFDVVSAIALKKMPGAQTVGNTGMVVYDAFGMPIDIKYYLLANINIYFEITIKALTGYSTSITTMIKTALMNFIESLDIGEDVYLSQAMAAASLNGKPEGQTFYIDTLHQGFAAHPSGSSNLTITFNQAANCDLSFINITVI
jgi:uncharacterized phage protein gp47/JayE